MSQDVSRYHANMGESLLLCGLSSGEAEDIFQSGGLCLFRPLSGLQTRTAYNRRFVILLYYLRYSSQDVD